MILLTDHVKQRAFERYRFSSTDLQNMCHKAVTKGFSINDAPHKKVKQFLKKRKSGDVAIYCKGAYVFVVKPLKNHLLLITTYRMPDHMLRYL